MTWDLQRYQLFISTSINSLLILSLPLVHTAYEREISTASNSVSTSVSQNNTPDFRIHTQKIKCVCVCLLILSQSLVCLFSLTRPLMGQFPREWPTSGSPADTGAQVDRLTQLCTDLSHCYQSERLLLLTGQTFRTSGTEPGTSPARGDAEGGMEGVISKK